MRTPRPSTTPLPLLTVLVLACAALLVSACGDDEGRTDDSTAVAKTAESPAEARLRELNEALDNQPGDADLLRERGELYLDNEVYDLAIADLQASLRADSARWETWHRLADAQLDGARSRDALNTMIFAGSRFRDRVGTLLKLAEFQYILQRYDDALATLDRAAQLDANEAEVFFMIGQVLREQADTARAINAYQRATELDAELLDAWLALGLLHEGLGNAIAERYFTTATNVARERAQPYRMRADYYVRQGRLAEALAGYDEAIARDPRLAEAFFNSALVLLDLDSVGRAREQLDRALAVRPMYPEALYFRGQALELQGDLDGARASYQQARNLAPSYDEPAAALGRLADGNDS